MEPSDTPCEVLTARRSQDAIRHETNRVQLSALAVPLPALPCDRRLALPGRWLRAGCSLAAKGALSETFSDPLDPASAKPDAFAFKVSFLKRSASYGSKHSDEHPLEIKMRAPAPTPAR